MTREFVKTLGGAYPAMTVAQAMLLCLTARRYAQTKQDEDCAPLTGIPALAFLASCGVVVVMCEGQPMRVPV